MSADRINSAGKIVLKSETINTSRTSGNSTVQVYSGSKLKMQAQKSLSLSMGASATELASSGDGNYELTVHFAYDASGGSDAEPPSNLHELESSMNQVEVWTNPVLKARFLATFGTQAAANSALAYAAKIVHLWETRGKAGSAEEALVYSGIDSVYPSTGNALIKNTFRGVAQHKVKNAIQFDTIYRRRITAASYNQVQAGFTGAGQIWTTNEVLAFENVPSAWWFRLPANYLWLKAQPVVATVSQQKTEISYSYLAVAEAWAMLYTAYGSATLLDF